MYSVFENHWSGGLFIDNDYEPTYCEQCGDEDRFVGNFDNYKQLTEECGDENGWTGHSEDYLERLFDEANERPNK